MGNVRLAYKPLPRMSVCDRKVFRADEYHCTRMAKYSVLILMERGILRFREDGHDVELTAGEYYIQRAGLLQEGVLLGDSPVYYYVEFEGAYTEDEEEGVPLRGSFDPERVLRIAERCVKSFYDKRTGAFLLNSYVLWIFSELCENSENGEDRRRTMERLREYLDANYASELCQSALARRFGYTQNHMIRLFRETWGVTPYRYVTELRMARARWLLKETSLGVGQVAATVGYSDVSVFYRQFVRTYGIAPHKAKKEQ